MSYNYLLKLYQVLDERIDQIDDEEFSDNTVSGESEYQRGRRDCLVDFKNYLKENYHDKLPRRIQKSLKP